MSYNSTILGIGLTLDTQDYSRELKATGKATSKVLSSLDAQAQNFSDRWSDITRNLRSVKSVASSMALYSTFRGVSSMIAAATSELISFSMHMENAAVSMEYFVEGTDKAAKSIAYLREMQELASKTSFTTESAINLSQFMSAMGINLKATKSVMKVINDAAAATGASEANMSRIVTALGQILTKGRLAAEEIRQLANANIPIYDILQEQMGLTGEQIKNIGKYWIDANDSVVAILTGLKSRYEGAADKIADTMSGMTNSIYDNSLMIGKVASSGAYEALESKLMVVRDALEKYRNVATNEGSTSLLRTLLLEADASGKVGTQLLTLIGNVRNLMSTYGSLYNTVKPLVGMFGQGLYYSVNTLIVGFTSLGEVVEGADELLAHFGISLKDVFKISAQVYITYKVAKTFGYVGQAAAAATMHIYNLVGGFSNLLPAALTASTGVKFATMGILGLGAVALYASGALDDLFNSFANLEAADSGLPSDFETQFAKYQEAMDAYNAAIKQYEGTFDESFESIASTGANTFRVLTRKSNDAANKSAERWLASFDEVYKVPDITEDVEDDDLNFADLSSLIKDLQYVFPAKITTELEEPDFDWSSVFSQDVAEGVGAAFEKFLPIGVTAMSLGLAQAFKKRFQEQQAKIAQATGKATPVETAAKKAEAQQVKFTDDVERSLNAASEALQKTGPDAITQLRGVRKTLEGLNETAIKLTGSTNTQLTLAIDSVNKRIDTLNLDSVLNKQFIRLGNILNNDDTLLSQEDLIGELRKQVKAINVIAIKEGATLSSKQVALLEAANNVIAESPQASVDQLTKRFAELINRANVVFDNDDVSIRFFLTDIDNALKEYTRLNKADSETAEIIKDSNLTYQRSLLAELKKTAGKAGVYDQTRVLYNLVRKLQNTLPANLTTTLKDNATSAANTFNSIITRQLKSTLADSSIEYITALDTAFKVFAGTTENATLATIKTDAILEKTAVIADTLQSEYSSTLRTAFTRNINDIKNVVESQRLDSLKEAFSETLKQFAVADSEIPRIVSRLVDASTTATGITAKFDADIIADIMDDIFKNSNLLTAAQDVLTEIKDVFNIFKATEKAPANFTDDNILKNIDALFLPTGNINDILKSLLPKRYAPAATQLNESEAVIKDALDTLIKRISPSYDMSEIIASANTLIEGISPDGKWGTFLEKQTKEYVTALNKTIANSLYTVLKVRLPEGVTAISAESLLKKLQGTFEAEGMTDLLHKLPDDIAKALKADMKADVAELLRAVTATDDEYVQISQLIDDHLTHLEVVTDSLLEEQQLTRKLQGDYAQMPLEVQDWARSFSSLQLEDADVFAFREAALRLDTLYTSMRKGTSLFDESPIADYQTAAIKQIGEESNTAIQKELTRYLYEQIIPRGFSATGNFAYQDAVSLKTGQAGYYRQLITNTLEAYADTASAAIKPSNALAKKELEETFAIVKESARKLGSQLDILSVMQRIITDDTLDAAQLQTLYPRLSLDKETFNNFVENFKGLLMSVPEEQLPGINKNFVERYSHLYDVMSNALDRPSTAEIADDVIAEARRADVFNQQVALAKAKSVDEDFFKKFISIFKDTKLFAAGGTLSAFVSDAGMDRFGNTIMEHIYNALQPSAAYKYGVNTAKQSSFAQVFGYQRGQYLEKWVGQMLLPGYFTGGVHAGNTWYDPEQLAVSQMDLAGRIDDVIMPIEVKTTSLGAHLDDLDRAVNNLKESVNTYTTETGLPVKVYSVPAENGEDFYKALQAYDSSAAVQIAHLANMSGRDKIAVTVIDANSDALNARLREISERLLSDIQTQQIIAEYGFDNKVLRAHIMRAIEEDLVGYDKQIAEATRTIVFTVPKSAKEQARLAVTQHTELMRAIISQYNAGIPLTDILQQVSATGIPLGMGRPVEQLREFAENMPLLTKGVTGDYKKLTALLGNILDRLRSQDFRSVVGAETDIRLLKELLSDTEALKTLIGRSNVVDSFNIAKLFKDITVRIPTENVDEFLGAGGVRDRLIGFLSSLEVHNATTMHSLAESLSRLPNDLRVLMQADNVPEINDFARVLTQLQKFISSSPVLRDNVTATDLLNALGDIKQTRSFTMTRIDAIEKLINKLMPDLQYATSDMLIERIKGLTVEATPQGSTKAVETVEQTTARITEHISDAATQTADEVIRTVDNLTDTVTEAADNIANATDNIADDIAKVIPNTTYVESFEDIAEAFRKTLSELDDSVLKVLPDTITLKKRFIAAGTTFKNFFGMFGTGAKGVFKASTLFGEFMSRDDLVDTFGEILNKLYGGIGDLTLRTKTKTVGVDALLTFITESLSGDLGRSGASTVTVKKSLEEALKKFLGDKDLLDKSDEAIAQLNKAFDALLQNSQTLNKFNFDSVIKGYGKLADIDLSDTAAIEDAWVKFIGHYKNIDEATTTAYKYAAQAINAGFADNLDDALKKLGKASKIDVSAIRNFVDVNMTRVIEVLGEGASDEAQRAAATMLMSLTESVNKKALLKGVVSKTSKALSMTAKLALSDLVPGIGPIDLLSYIVTAVQDIQENEQYRKEYNAAIDSYLAATLGSTSERINSIKVDAGVNKALDDFWNNYGDTVAEITTDAAATVMGTVIGSVVQGFITGTAATSFTGPGALIGGLVAGLAAGITSMAASDAGYGSFYNQYAEDLKNQIDTSEYYNNLIDKGYTVSDAEQISEALNKFTALRIADSTYDSAIARGEGGAFQWLGTSEYASFRDDLKSLIINNAAALQDVRDYAGDAIFSDWGASTNKYYTSLFRTLVKEVEAFQAGNESIFYTDTSEGRNRTNEAQRLYAEMEAFLVHNALGTQDEGFTDSMLKFAQDIELSSNLNMMREALKGIDSGMQLLSAYTGQTLSFYDADISTQTMYAESLGDIYRELTKQATNEVVAEQIQGILSGGSFTLGGGETATIFATLSTESAEVTDGLRRLYESLGLTALSADTLKDSLKTLNYNVDNNVDLSKIVAFGTASQEALEDFRSNLAGWAVNLPDSIDIGTLSAEDVSILANAGIQITDQGAIFAQAQEAGEAGGTRDFDYNVANVTAAEAERLADVFGVTFDEAGNILLDKLAIAEDLGALTFSFDADMANFSAAANTILAGYYEELDKQDNVVNRIPTGFEGLGEYNTETGTFTITNAEILAGNMTIEDWVNQVMGTEYGKELFTNAQGGHTELYDYLVGLSKDAEALDGTYKEGLMELAQSAIRFTDTNVADYFGSHTQEALGKANIATAEYGDKYAISYGYLGEGWESGLNRINTSDYNKLSDAAKNALDTLSDVYGLGLKIGNVYTTMDVSKTFDPAKMKYFYSVLDEANLKLLPQYTLEWLKATDAIQQNEDGTYIWVQGMEAAATGLVSMSENVLSGYYAFLNEDLQSAFNTAAESALGAAPQALEQFTAAMQSGYTTVTLENEAFLASHESNAEQLIFTWDELVKSQDTSLQSLGENILRAYATQKGWTDASTMDIENLKEKVETDSNLMGVSFKANVETAFGDAAQLFDDNMSAMSTSAGTAADAIEQAMTRITEAIDRMSNMQLAEGVGVLDDTRWQGFGGWHLGGETSPTELKNLGDGKYQFFFGKASGGSGTAYEISDASNTSAAAKKLVAKLQADGMTADEIAAQLKSSVNTYGTMDEATKSFVRKVYEALGKKLPEDLKGFANGGIISNDGLYRIAEQNKQEAIIPLENPVVSGHIGAAIASMIFASEEFKSLSALQGIRDGGISTRLIEARYSAAAQQRSPDEMVATMADAVLQRVLPTLSASSGTNESTDTRTPVYVGTLIADDTGLRELNKKMKIIEAKESRRA